MTLLQIAQLPISTTTRQDTKTKHSKCGGKFKGSSGYYTLNENNTCCRWQFEVRMDSGVSTPKSGANVTVAGKCVVNKVNGITRWYLLVSEIN